MAKVNSSYLPLQCGAVRLSRISSHPCALKTIPPTYSASQLQATNEKQLKVGDWVATRDILVAIFL